MKPQYAIVPGILLGSLILIMLAHLLSTVTPAAASTPVASPSSDSNTVQSSTCIHSLPDSIAPWCRLIEEAAKKYDVPVELIASVMLQESGGQAEVISSSGAVGLLQVMPSDGIAAGFMCTNGPCFSSRPTIQELLDPAFNIDYGVRMLASLLNQYGSEREALKAYGPYDVGYYYADKVLAIQENL